MWLFRGRREPTGHGREATAPAHVARVRAVGVAWSRYASLEHEEQRRDQLGVVAGLLHEVVTSVPAAAIDDELPSSADIAQVMAAHLVHVLQNGGAMHDTSSIFNGQDDAGVSSTQGDTEAQASSTCSFERLLLSSVYHLAASKAENLLSAARTGLAVPLMRWLCNVLLADTHTAADPDILHCVENLCALLCSNDVAALALCHDDLLDELAFGSSARLFSAPAHASTASGSCKRWQSGRRRICIVLRELGNSGLDNRPPPSEQQGSSQSQQGMAMAVSSALHTRGIIKAVMDNIRNMLDSANESQRPDVRETASCMMQLACSLIQSCQHCTADTPHLHDTFASAGGYDVLVHCLCLPGAELNPEELENSNLLLDCVETLLLISAGMDSHHLSFALLLDALGNVTSHVSIHVGLVCQHGQLAVLQRLLKVCAGSNLVLAQGLCCSESVFTLCKWIISQQTAPGHPESWATPNLDAMGLFSSASWCPILSESSSVETQASLPNGSQQSRDAEFSLANALMSIAKLGEQGPVMVLQGLMDTLVKVCTPSASHIASKQGQSWFPPGRSSSLATQCTSGCYSLTHNSTDEANIWMRTELFCVYTMGFIARACEGARECFARPDLGFLHDLLTFAVLHPLSPADKWMIGMQLPLHPDTVGDDNTAVHIYLHSNLPLQMHKGDVKLRKRLLGDAALKSDLDGQGIYHCLLTHNGVVSAGLLFYLLHPDHPDLQLALSERSQPVCAVHQIFVDPEFSRHFEQSTASKDSMAIETTLMYCCETFCATHHVTEFVAHLPSLPMLCTYTGCAYAEASTLLHALSFQPTSQASVPRKSPALSVITSDVNLQSFGERWTKTSANAVPDYFLSDNPHVMGRQLRSQHRHFLWEHCAIVIEDLLSSPSRHHAPAILMIVRETWVREVGLDARPIIGALLQFDDTRPRVLQSLVTLVTSDAQQDDADVEIIVKNFLQAQPQSPFANPTVKIDILRALCRMFTLNPRVKDAFREFGGFLCMVSLLMHLERGSRATSEKTMAMDASPIRASPRRFNVEGLLSPSPRSSFPSAASPRDETLTSAGHIVLSVKGVYSAASYGESGSSNQCADCSGGLTDVNAWRLMEQLFRTITVAMANHPPNRSFFWLQIGFTDLLEVLNLMGMFSQLGSDIVLRVLIDMALEFVDIGDSGENDTVQGQSTEDYLLERYRNHTVIHNPEAILLVITFLKCFLPEVQGTAVNVVKHLVALSTHNRCALASVQLGSAVLKILQQAQTSSDLSPSAPAAEPSDVFPLVMQHELLCLLGQVGQYSMSASELRQCFQLLESASEEFVFFLLKQMVLMATAGHAIPFVELQPLAAASQVGQSAGSYLQFKMPANKSWPPSSAYTVSAWFAHPSDVVGTLMVPLFSFQSNIVNKSYLSCLLITGSVEGNDMLCISSDSDLVENAIVSLPPNWRRNMTQSSTSAAGHTEWHLLALVHTRQRFNFKKSTVSVFLDGVLLGNEKMPYNLGSGSSVDAQMHGYVGCLPPGVSVPSQTYPFSLLTNEGVHGPSRVRWKCGAIHCWEDACSNEVLHLIYCLGPSYVGQFRDDLRDHMVPGVLAHTKKFRSHSPSGASAAGGGSNQTGSPHAAHSNSTAGILETDPVANNTAAIPSDKLVALYHPAVLRQHHSSATPGLQQMGLDYGSQGKSRMWTSMKGRTASFGPGVADADASNRGPSLSNLATPASASALASPDDNDAFLCGDAALYNPLTLADAIRQIGGMSLIFHLIDRAGNARLLRLSLQLLVLVVKDNPWSVQEMERIKGYRLLAYLLDKKREYIDANLAEFIDRYLMEASIFDLSLDHPSSGNTQQLNEPVQAPGTVEAQPTIIENLTALSHTLCTLIFKPSAGSGFGTLLQKTVFRHWCACVDSSSNPYAAHNAIQLRSVSVVQRTTAWLIAEEGVEEETLMAAMDLLSSLLNHKQASSFKAEISSVMQILTMSCCHSSGAAEDDDGFSTRGNTSSFIDFQKISPDVPSNNLEIPASTLFDSTMTSSIAAAVLQEQQEAVPITVCPKLTGPRLQPPQWEYVKRGLNVNDVTAALPAKRSAEDNRVVSLRNTMLELLVDTVLQSSITQGRVLFSVIGYSWLLHMLEHCHNTSSRYHLLSILSFFLTLAPPSYAGPRPFLKMQGPGALCAVLTSSSELSTFSPFYSLLTRSLLLGCGVPQDGLSTGFLQVSLGPDFKPSPILPIPPVLDSMQSLAPDTLLLMVKLLHSACCTLREWNRRPVFAFKHARQRATTADGAPPAACPVKELTRSRATRRLCRTALLGARAQMGSALAVWKVVSLSSLCQCVACTFLVVFERHTGNSSFHSTGEGAPQQILPELQEVWQSQELLELLMDAAMISITSGGSSIVGFSLQSLLSKSSSNQDINLPRSSRDSPSTVLSFDLSDEPAQFSEHRATPPPLPISPTLVMDTGQSAASTPSPWSTPSDMYLANPPSPTGTVEGLCDVEAKSTGLVLVQLLASMATEGLLGHFRTGASKGERLAKHLTEAAPLMIPNEAHLVSYSTLLVSNILAKLSDSTERTRSHLSTIIRFVKFAVDKVCQGRLKGTVDFALLDFSLLMLPSVLSQRAGWSGTGGTPKLMLHDALNRLILQMLEHYQCRRLERDRMLEMLLAHSNVLFGASNNDREFYGCLCHILCPFRKAEDSRTDGPWAKPVDNVLATWRVMLRGKPQLLADLLQDSYGHFASLAMSSLAHDDRMGLEFVLAMEDPVTQRDLASVFGNIQSHVYDPYRNKMREHVMTSMKDGSEERQHARKHAKQKREASLCRVGACKKKRIKPMVYLSHQCWDSCQGFQNKTSDAFRICENLWLRFISPVAPSSNVVNDHQRWMWSLDSTEGPCRMRKKFVRAPYNIASTLFKDGGEQTTESMNSPVSGGPSLLMRTKSFNAQPVASPSLLDADSARRRGSTTLAVSTDEWPDDDGSPFDDDYDELFGLEGDSFDEEVEDLGFALDESVTDRILPLLDPADGGEILFRCNCSAVVGMDKVDGIFVLSPHSVLVIAGFRVSATDGAIVSDSCFDVEDSSSGFIFSDSNVWRAPLQDVKEVHKRRFSLQPIALEIFLKTGMNHLIVFNAFERDEAHGRLLSSLPGELPSGGSSRSSILGVPESSNRSAVWMRSIEKVQARWQRCELSNLEYLMILNTMSGRTQNDLNQYAIFPWVIQDFTSATLDLSKPSSFRDLSKPMGAQTLGQAASIAEQYSEREEMSQDFPFDPPFHYGTHYSTPAFVLYFLMRLQPYAKLSIQLQSGHFDAPDRMFSELATTYNSICTTSRGQDVRELIPEMYYLPQLFSNIGQFDLGAKQDGGHVDDVVLPPWAHNDPWLFTKRMRQALESDYVSQHLHEWIDLIFGVKQKGKAAEDSLNLFYYLTYEGGVDIDAITDPVEREAKITQINAFGQCPTQLFKKAHPARGQSTVLSPDTVPANPGLLVPKQIRPRGGQAVGDIAFLQDRLVTVGLHSRILLPRCSRFVRWNCPDLSLRVHHIGANSFSSDNDKLVSSKEHLHDGEITCVDVSSDGQYLVTGGNDTTVAVWRTVQRDAKWAWVRDLCLHEGPVSCVAISTEYNLIVSGGFNRQAILWDLNRLRHVCTLPPLPAPSVDAVAIHHQTGYVITCARLTLRISDVNGITLAMQDTAKLGSEAITCVAMSYASEWMDENVYVTGHKDGMVKFWSLRSTSEAMAAKGVDTASGCTVTMPPMLPLPVSETDQVRGVNSPSEDELNKRKRLPMELFCRHQANHHNRPVTAMLITRDQKQLLSGDSEGCLLSWSSQGECEGSLV